MPNIHDCLGAAQRAGTIGAVRANQARAVHQGLVARYERIMPLHQAQALAAADLKEATRRAARGRYHAVVNQLQAMRRLKAAMDGASDPAVALRNLLEHSEDAAAAGYTGESVKTVAAAYRAQANAMIAEVLERHSLDLTGRTRDPAGFRNLVLEAHGQATGDAEAKRLAAALGRAQEWLRQMFNAHGGAIERLQHYGLPHSHDVYRLRKAGFAQWRADIEGGLDWTAITDVTTGRPFAATPGVVPPAAVTERFLRDVFEGLTTGGWDDRAATLATGGKALYNQHADHRVLHFQPEGWLDYNRAYGGTDPFSAMVNGLHGLANDVAEMRVLGPSPRAGLEYAAQVAQKRASTLAASGSPAALKMEAAVEARAKLARAMLAEQDGSASVPVSEGWARFFAGTRAVLTSVQLGSAILSSTTDPATIGVAAHIMGMRPGNVLGRSVRLMASHATRTTAARMGYVAETLADAGGGYSRFMGGVLGTGIPEKLAGFTLRASGLSYVTDMHRIAFQMEFAGLLAENADRVLADIDAPIRALFEARGITAADWDHLRAPGARFRTQTGEDFITPFHWLEHQTSLPRDEAAGLAMRLSMAVREQLELALPEASLEGRARVLSGTAPGTIGGELLRSTLMYKGFTLSFMLGQYYRFLSIPGGMGRGLYAVSLFTPLILMGALAVQLKEVAKGRDPRPMNTWAFLGAALMQSGGLGIFGDFFSASTNRVGGGLAETIAGPVVSLASQIAVPVASNVSRALSGEATSWGRDVANLARRNTPVASSLWPTRVAFDRLVADQLQDFLDPEAELAWRRQERQREQESGTATWWERGAGAPSRGPDLSNIWSTE